jgi:integrase/recombinase XerD
MKSDFTRKLFDLNIPMETVCVVLDQLDIIAHDYDIQKRCTEVAVYDFSLPELAKNYLVTKTVEGLSESTLYNYKRLLEIFFQTTKKIPEHIRTEDITYFLYWYKKRNPDREISDRSLDKVLDTLKSFFKWSFDRDYIKRNPAAVIRPIKYEKKIQDHLTDVELEKVRRACITSKEKAIVELFFSTGCRVAEVANMKLSDINWDNRTVTVFGKGKKQRIAFLNVRSCFTLQEYIEHYRKGSSEFLFVSDRKPHGQMHNSGIEKIVNNIAVRANIEKNLTPHVFRRTVATHMLEKGASIQDIQKILGHEKIETTLRYAKVNMKQVQETHRKYVS